MRRTRYWVTTAFAAWVVFMSGGQANGQSATTRFVPFKEFLAKTAAAGFSSASGKVSDVAAFGEMRQHILKMYEGVQVTHSFVVGSQTYDCIPIEQQPAMRLNGLKDIATAPPASAAPGSNSAGVTGRGQQAGQTAAASIFPTGVDSFGNTIGCEDKTVPIGRTTLEQMSQFQTLQAFLRKSPDGKGKPPVPLAPTPAPASANSIDAYIPPSPVQHLHDYTYQWIYNLGGNSTLSIHNPYVYTPWGEVFSLSQVWYIGFNNGLTQTVEAGWQVYPDRLGDESPHLFAYYTADNYNKTGCYDYTCGAFVQYSGSLFLGAAFSPVSVPGGAQYEVPIKWEWWYGNWWLAVNGTWVGYYPGWLFGAGDMATHSSLIEFGGEIVGGNGTSYNYYPPMGSGYFGTSGWPWAAYQRQIWYFDAAYGGQWASLGSGNECPARTSLLGPYWGGSAWAIYFFFGGPGGWC
jgi:Neprosin